MSLVHDINGFGMKDPKALLLLTQEEIGDILRDRLKYNQKLSGDQKLKKDYIAYIVYEQTLLGNVKKRQLERECEFNLAETIVQKIKALYDEVTNVYPTDERIWDEYIKFCKLQSLDIAATRKIVERMRLVHTNEPKYWLKAIQWERDNKTSPEKEAALFLATKAAAAFKTNVPIFFELIDIILTSATTPEGVRLERALKAYKLFNRKELEMEQLVRLLDKVKKHSFANGLEKEILIDMRTLHYMKPLFWHTIAIRELDGRFTYDDPKLTPEQNTATRTPRERLERCHVVYDAAVTDLNIPDMWNYYLGTMYAEYVRDSELSELFVALAFKRADQQGFMNVQHYKYYVQIMYDCKAPSDVVEAILKRASKRHPRSAEIWTMYVKHFMRLDDLESVTLRFQKARMVLEPKDLVPLWQLYVNFMRAQGIGDQHILQACSTYDDVCDQRSELFDGMICEYLQYAYTVGGLSKMRHVFEKLCIGRRVTMKMYELVYEYEAMQIKPELNAWRKMNAAMLLVLGRSSIAGWMKVLEFEKTFGTIENEQRVTAKAEKMLTPDLYAELLREAEKLDIF